MIFTKISGNLKDDASVKSKHIETAMVKSDDLSKVILRVKSDHGNEFGIRLSDDEKLENGSYFIIDEGHILALSVIPEEMIIITPKDINDMGIIAHTLGNLHKPVQVRDGKISLLYDPVVEVNLKKIDTPFCIEKVQLEEALHYANLSSDGAHKHEGEGHKEHHHTH